MLRELRIQNFKGWEDTGIVRMAPITLLFGTNSTGKSSIGQFLMMLRQTVDSPDRKAVFYPGGKNSAVQLGSFSEMVYRRDRSNKIAFKYTWDLRDPLRVKDPISETTFAGNRISFEASVGVGPKQAHALVLHELHYELLDGNGGPLVVKMWKAEPPQKGYQVETRNYLLRRKVGRPWQLGAPVRFYGFPDELVAYYQNGDFVQDLSFAHEKLFSSVFYLGPLRIKPERLYSWSGIEPESVGYSGENTVAALLAARSREISLGKKKWAAPFEQVIAGKLAQMGLIDSFEVKSISKQRQEYEVKLRTKGSGESVDLPDVGFGVSQVLPVLVQSFYAPAESIIIMEQPELHLHPSAQAALADVMIDVINARENGHDRNIQLLIESHSEHFLRRLQRRIAEDKLSHEKLSAYFATVSRTGATLEPLDIDMFGNILNWPENFFGDDMGDVTAHAKAAMLKKRSLRGRNYEESNE